MSLIHLHLLLTHVPVVGAVLGVALLLLAARRRSDELTRLGLGFFALLGAVSLVVFLTGEPAEEIAERLPGFSEALTERHEEMALIATISACTFGVLAAFALAVFRRRALPRWAAPVAVVGSLGVSALMGYTANLGGQIRHTQIRSASTVVGENGTRAGASESESATPTPSR